MTCDEVQSLLLQFDDGSGAPDGVFERAESHAAGCAVCADMVRKLRRLQDAVRSLPEPPQMLNSMLEARLRFERQYADKVRGSAAATAAPRTSRRSWIGPARWAAAAAILLALGGGTFAYVYHQQAQSRMLASSQAIDQGLGLNLSISEGESEAEREKLFAVGSQDFRQAIDAGELRGDDREFADRLLEGAKLLTVTPDPLGQADHFTRVADLLVTRMDNAARKNPKALAHLGQAYLNVANRGIHKNLDLAASSELTPEERRRLEKIVQRNLVIQAKLQGVVRDNPDQAQVRKQLEQIDHRLRRLQQKLNATTQPVGGAKRSPIR